MSARRKRIVILDTHAILHRAYHALPDFSSSKGEPTGALYGLISMLMRIVADLKPDYIIAAFDLPGGTFRDEMFEAYKATRVEAEDDLIAQIKRSRDVLDAFGVPRYEKEGYEADDVIGTVVEKLKKKGDMEIVIASGDMDTLQLVEGKRVRVFTLKKGLSETALYDEDAVKQRFGFGPELLPDYKGLRGDPSDNIPGVKGIGEKTATELIVGFGSIEKLYQALKKDEKKLLSKGIKAGIIEKLKSSEKDALLSKKLGEIHKNVPIDFALPKKEWRQTLEPEKVLDMIAEFEFRSLIPRVKELFGGKSKAGAEEMPSPASGQGGNAFEGISSASSEELEKAALAVWVLDTNISEPTLEDVLRIGKSKDVAEAYKNIVREIHERELTFVYEKIELPLAPVLRRMEKRGVLIDTEFLKNLSKEYHEELQRIEKRIYKHAGEEFNVGSPRQLGEVLFDRLGLAVKNQKKTATGARSTRESELQKMKGLHPIVEDILAHRELSKLLGTYIDTFPALLDKERRVHTHFIQTGAATGRLASKDPNLQNIPIKTELGRRIRHAFVAQEGFKFVAFDYSQIELRIAAILSGDRALCEIFKRGRDVHAEVAARIFGTAPGGGVSYEARRVAKVINFGILYGMGVTSLQQTLGTNRKEAQEFYHQYFKSFPTLADYIDEVKADAHRRGFTQTLFGRRRYFAGIRSPIPYVRAAAERMAINAPIQGTQADVVKLAMIRIDELFEKEGLREQAHMLLQVHDELVFEIAEDEVERLAPKIKEIMEEVIPRKERKGVPLVAQGKVGPNWGEMKEL